MCVHAYKRLRSTSVRPPHYTSPTHAGFYVLAHIPVTPTCHTHPSQMPCTPTRQQVADITSQCTGVTRFLLACMDDLQHAKMGTVTRKSGSAESIPCAQESSAQESSAQEHSACVLALTPGMCSSGGKASAEHHNHTCVPARCA